MTHVPVVRLSHLTPAERQGLSGNRLAAQSFIQSAIAEKERKKKLEEEYYQNLTILKRHGLAVIEECKRENVPPPRDLLPHPDDIVLKPGIRGLGYWPDGSGRTSTLRQSCARFCTYEWRRSANECSLLRASMPKRGAKQFPGAIFGQL